MLWYADLHGTGITQEAVDAALREARRERAAMMATLLRGLVQGIGRGARAVLRGIADMQSRRASAYLRRAREDDGVRAHVAAVRGEMPGPVCQVLSHPEATRGEDPTTGHDPNPRLAA